MSQLKKNDCILTWQTGIWYLCSGLVQCSMPRVLWCNSEETEEDQDENDIEDFVAFSTKSLEESATLHEGASKTVSGFMSVQPVADQCDDTTIETTDVGFTFAGGETEAASTNIMEAHESVVSRKERTRRVTNEHTRAEAAVNHSLGNLGCCVKEAAAATLFFDLRSTGPREQ